MDKVYDIWLAEKLINFKGEVRPLFERYSSAYDIFSESFDSTRSDIDISENCALALSDKNLDSAKRILATCAQLDISIVPYTSELYPEFLKEIEKPPCLLFVRGNVNLLKERFCVSTVGTRRMSSYGKYYGFKISYELASAGAVIVSGMAKGIDSVTHAGALAAGGKTIAVLGCGVDVVYPKEHLVLYKKIIESGGAVISEFMPGTAPFGGNFPVRNRIICGISYSTVVVEAPKKSGALITAGEAIKEGRTVFALPGNINSTNSYGTNELIQGGARLIKNASDILDEYRYLSNININFDGYRRAFASKELCDRTIIDLKVAADLYDNEPFAYKMADKIFSTSAKETEVSVGIERQASVKEEVKADFPFSVYQNAGAEMSKKMPEKTHENKSEEILSGNNAVKVKTPIKSVPVKTVASVSAVVKETSVKNDMGASASVKEGGEEQMVKNTAPKTKGKENVNNIYADMLYECEQFGVVPTDQIKKVCTLLCESGSVTVDSLCRDGCSVKDVLRTLSVLMQAGVLEESAGGVYKLRK